MRRYQFVVGVSLSALEETLNRLVSQEPGLKLNQVFYAHGTGFVAAVERSESPPASKPTEGLKQPEAPKSKPRSQKKSG
jgi:hypothetical protein